MGKKKPKTKSNKQVEIKKESASDAVDDSIISFTSTSQTVLMKVCRLCESKDGPFLNIFDADTVTIKKIDEIMPFVISENDDLPHKICFRCSAKVEELYEFIQKCIKTQESLRTELGKKGPLYTKTKTRVLWEKKLNQSNMSNDDICNALIKKAMEGIKDIPLNTPEEVDSPLLNKKVKGSNESSVIKKEPPLPIKKDIHESDDDHDEITLKQVKLSIEKCDEKVPLTRSSRSSKNDSLLEGLPPNFMTRQYPNRKSHNKVEASSDKNSKDETKHNDKLSVNIPVSPEKKVEEPSKVEPSKPPEPPAINIMDHVSIIKVHDVGTLFLCKLCNRNFLKKEVVFSHGCAKNNVPKDAFMQNSVAPPQVPKPSTVKYIKMDNKDFKRPVTTDTKTVEKKPPPTNIEKHVNIPVQPEIKPKPRAGPASRMNRSTQNPPSDHNQQTNQPSEPARPIAKPVTPDANTSVPTVNFPGIPSLNTRYKLVPGPNNMFSLVEDSETANQSQPSVPAVPPNLGRKRNLPGTASNKTAEISNYQHSILSSNPQTDSNVEVFDIEDDPPQPEVEQPYPVGLFQTVPHHSGVLSVPRPSAPPSFTTPAMKKQSYTIVQTGNPSKLLISAKPQPNTEEGPSRKKSKKSKNDAKNLESSNEAFNVSIDDTSSSKNPGFFTFINVDPLLQPSYVLPTDNIIQESQISTSTPASKAVVDNKDKDNKYECNMCNEKFSREKKLLAHIQSHYKQMDEEDQLRAEKAPSKRKTRKV